MAPKYYCLMYGKGRHSKGLIEAYSIQKVLSRRESIQLQQALQTMLLDAIKTFDVSNLF